MLNVVDEPGLLPEVVASPKTEPGEEEQYEQLKSASHESRTPVSALVIGVGTVKLGSAPPPEV
jgi:hypothetical protein